MNNLDSNGDDVTIKYLMKIMQRYRTVDIKILNPKMKKDKLDSIKWCEIRSASNFPHVYKEAAEVCRREYVEKTWEEKLFDYEHNISTKTSKNYYDKETSRRLLTQWIREQGFEEISFLDELFSVLKKENSNINTLTLYGSEHSGASWLLQSLKPIIMFWGEIVDGQKMNFMWENCLNTPVILLEEFLITDKNVDQCKLILGGSETSVCVTSKPNQIMSRTPVIITNSEPPWKYITVEKESLKSCMYVRYCRAQPWVDTLIAKLNPALWKIVYFDFMYKKRGLPTSITEIQNFENKTPTELELSMLRDMDLDGKFFSISTLKNKCLNHTTYQNKRCLTSESKSKKKIKLG